jgi:alpha-methylacyl-CoA racemase
MHSLTGIRVVSMALNVPGPFAVARLVAEGAHVTKIEPPGGDPLAATCRSLYDEIHRGVTIESLDLKSQAGHTRAVELLSDTDLFLSSQRPAALDRLGMTADRLAQTRWVNIVGERAQPEVPGHDLTYQARAGLLKDSLPVTLLADVMGSERAFSAMLLLLREPRGARAVVGLYDSLAPLVAPLRHGLTAEDGLLGGRLVTYNVYRAREGRVAIAALEPHFRERLYTSLGLAEGADLTDVMRTRTAGEWQAWATERDLPLVSFV